MEFAVVDLLDNSPFITNSCKKDFKKLNIEAVKFIRFKVFEKISKEPFLADKLKGNKYNFLFKYAFKFKKTIIGSFILLEKRKKS